MHRFGLCQFDISEEMDVIDRVLQNCFGRVELQHWNKRRPVFGFEVLLVLLFDILIIDVREYAASRGVFVPLTQIDFPRGVVVVIPLTLLQPVVPVAVVLVPVFLLENAVAVFEVVPPGALVDVAVRVDHEAFAVAFGVFPGAKFREN